MRRVRCLKPRDHIHRRDDERNKPRALATIEIDQIQFQINAAEIRQAIAEKELENQEMQIENTKAVDDYMRNKYTNDQLFSWMITQISTVYFQAYQLAFDMAKKAEKCYGYELGITDSNIIQFGYWDSLKKGLLSGDKLMSDLRRLEAEYINQNKREFEITKHISLGTNCAVMFNHVERNWSMYNFVTGVVVRYGLSRSLHAAN